jgi:hypothetical protein
MFWKIKVPSQGSGLVAILFVLRNLRQQVQATRRDSLHLNSHLYRTSTLITSGGAWVRREIFAKKKKRKLPAGRSFVWVSPPLGDLDCCSRRQGCPGSSFCGSRHDWTIGGRRQGCSTGGIVKGPLLNRAAVRDGAHDGVVGLQNWLASGTSLGRHVPLLTCSQSQSAWSVL